MARVGEGSNRKLLDCSNVRGGTSPHLHIPLLSACFGTEVPGVPPEEEEEECFVTPQRPREGAEGGKLQPRCVAAVGCGCPPRLSPAAVWALQGEQAALFDQALAVGEGNKGHAPRREFPNSKNVPDMKTCCVTSRKKNFLVQLRSSQSSYNYTAVRFGHIRSV